MFHAHAKQLVKLVILFVFFWYSAFWKTGGMVTILEVNNSQISRIIFFCFASFEGTRLDC
jgi:hypothetical protein